MNTWHIFLAWWTSLNSFDGQHIWFIRAASFVITFIHSVAIFLKQGGWGAVAVIFVKVTFVLVVIMMNWWWQWWEFYVRSVRDILGWWCGDVRAMRSMCRLPQQLDECWKLNCGHYSNSNIALLHSTYIILTSTLFSLVHPWIYSTDVYFYITPSSKFPSPRWSQDITCYSPTSTLSYEGGRL